jgi:hypothetical protein
MTEPHPDDESLSAALDGEDAAAAAHVAACAACLARTDALRATSAAVAADPVAGPPPGLADRAVAAALAAFEAERVATGPTMADPSEGENVVPLHRAGPAVPDSFSSHRPPGQDARRRVPTWVLGVAAALAAVLVAVPVLTRGGDDSGDTVASRAADTGASTFAAGPLIEGGDLGERSDQLELGNLLTGVLSAGAAPESAAQATAPDAASTPTAASPAGAEAPAGVAADGSTATRGAAPVPAGTSEPSPLAGAPPATQATKDLATDPSAVRACEEAVAKDYTKGLGLGPLVYRATLRWQGTPAVVLAYRLADTSGAGADHQAFVMALDGCRLLVVQGF